MSSDLFQPERQPPRSEWSRCCRRSSGTGLRGPPESQSTPETGSHRFSSVRGKGRTDGRSVIWEAVWVWGGVTYSCLSRDVGAAHYVGPSQRFLPLGPLPQRDEGGHVCGGHTESADTKVGPRRPGWEGGVHFKHINRLAQTRPRCRK